MFEPEVFRKQIYCNEVLVRLLGLFGAPRSHSAPGELRPCTHFTPLITAQRRASTNHGTQL